MHWSKSRQVDYESCPRKFFYSEIAAPQNFEIRALAEAQTPALVAHEVVRTAVYSILTDDGWQPKQLPEVIKGCEKRLETALKDPRKAAAESSIVTACISGFAKSVLPKLRDGKVVYVSDGNPVEFIYDDLTFSVHPEVAIRRLNKVEIYNWRSGSFEFHRDNEFRLKAGGLTCWARAVLKEVTKPVAVYDYYLRGLRKFKVTLSDHEVREFVARAKDVSKRYSASARIADFPSHPDWGNCRWCNFKVICPDYEGFE